jgi:hypothetical protein
MNSRPTTIWDGTTTIPMPGSVVDLSVPGAVFPDPIVVDTNLLVERLIYPFLGLLPGATPQPVRATQFFRGLAARRGSGIVTPTVFNEFVHSAVHLRYKQELLKLGGTPNQIQRYGRPINNWKVLYKIDPGILHAFAPDLLLLRQILIGNGMLVLAPDELGPTRSGLAFDEELVHIVGTFGLDANDAAILLEAERYGVTDIVTLDADLQRAQKDFTIYTWL